MKLRDRVKSMIRDWLEIQPAQPQSIVIIEPTTFGTNVVRNQIWYRGDPAEIRQFYTQLDDGGTNTERFWAAVPQGEKVRMIHTGLPALMVDVIAGLVVADMADIDFGDELPGEDVWETIREEIDWVKLIEQALKDVLSSGDGAFKLSVDPEVSQYPLVEFFPADRVEYVRQRGKITAIKFYTAKQHKGKQYRLCETYGIGSVTYALYDGDKELPLNAINGLDDLRPVTFTGDYMMAVPLIIYDSPKFRGRGKAIYESKLDCFDALDEVVSQWMDALRAGRVSKYIPKDMIPVNPENGELGEVNSFGTNFVVTEPVLSEGARQDKIDVVQPDISYDAFLATYTATMDMCLQGIVSPATLGIDVGKMSSADAQREKKDITGATRNTITTILEKVLPQLVSVILQTYDNMQGKTPGRYSPVVTFGEYGAPSFDSRIESVAKAAAGSIMSVEAQVDELWGNSKDDDWKQEEIARIKRERGIDADTDPPKIGDDLIDVE